MAPASVIITPESEISFQISSTEMTPRAVITLKHPGGDVGSIAFKVSSL